MRLPVITALVLAIPAAAAVITSGNDIRPSIPPLYATEQQLIDQCERDGYNLAQAGDAAPEWMVDATIRRCDTPERSKAFTDGYSAYLMGI